MNKIALKYVLVGILVVAPSIVAASNAPAEFTHISIISNGDATVDNSNTISVTTGEVTNEFNDGIVSVVETSQNNVPIVPVSETGQSETPSVRSTDISTSHDLSATNYESTNVTESSSNSSSASVNTGSHRARSSGTSVSNSCSLITSYMKKGGNNDKNEVIKLQTFLKNVMKSDVEINGIFDEKTENAVKAFQAANKESTMGPWGTSEPTGVVYITTLKTLNKVACNQPLALNSDELAIINSYKNGNGTNNAVLTVKAGDNTPSVTIGLNGDEVEADKANIENAAAVAKAPVMSRFWKFLVSLFK